MSYFYLEVNGEFCKDNKHLEAIEAMVTVDPRTRYGFRFMSQCRWWDDADMIKVMCEYSKRYPGILFSVRWYVCQEENPDGVEDKMRYYGPNDLEAACEYEARRDFKDGKYQDWTVTISVTADGDFKSP